MDKQIKYANIVLVSALLVGLADALYLSYSYLTANPVNCFLFDGCGAVSASPYSKPFGIPLSFLGTAFYFGMLVLVFLNYKYKAKIVSNLLILGAVSSFIASLYFVYLQGFVIQAFCIYCLISAGAVTIALCSLLYIRGLSNNSSNNTPQAQGTLGGNLM